MVTRYALPEETNASPVQGGSCARQGFNHKAQQRMSYKLLHGGGHTNFLAQSISRLHKNLTFLSTFKSCSGSLADPPELFIRASATAALQEQHPHPCWGDEIRFFRETLCVPPCSGLKLMRRHRFNSKALLRMSLNPLHGGYISFLGQSVSRLPCWGDEVFFVRGNLRLPRAVG